MATIFPSIPCTLVDIKTSLLDFDDKIIITTERGGGENKENLYHVYASPPSVNTVLFLLNDGFTAPTLLSISLVPYPCLSYFVVFPNA